MRIKFSSWRLLTIFAFVPLTCSADARSKLWPAAQYPGPWLEITEEVRETLALHKISACNEAVGRQSSINSGEYLLYCTRDERFWTSWLVQPATHKVRGPGTLLEGIPLPHAY
ncbi:MAG TPA: hypothetical protein VFI94_13430 [Pseudolabrys sp.]|nr:hypothetical protein [Pseudolabrys sp.]